MVPCRQHRLLRLRGIGGVHRICGVHGVRRVTGETEKLQTPCRGAAGSIGGKPQVIAACTAKPVAAQLPLGGNLLQSPDAVVVHDGPYACLRLIFSLIDVVAGFRAIVQVLAVACILHIEAALSSNQAPDAIGVIGTDLSIRDGQIRRHQPGAGRSGSRHKGRGCAAICRLAAGTVNQVLSSSHVLRRGDVHLGIGCSLRSKGRCGQHGQNHGHQQQPRQESAPGVCVHIHPPFLFLPFGSVWGDCLNYHTTSSGNALLPVSTFYQNLTLFVRIGKHIMKFALSWPQSIFCGPGRKWPGILPLSGKYILTKHIQSLIMEWCG